MTEAALDLVRHDRALLKKPAACCPACGSGQTHTFHEIRNVPANSCILFSSEEAARRCPTGDIRLALCAGCGFVFNSAFDLARTEYSGRYEETQAYSGTFNKFHRGLAEGLIEKHGLYGKRVVEIGCGKGEFLLLLAELGGNSCLGIDPGVNVERLRKPARGELRVIPEFYSERHVAEAVDLVLCKMTLEHIPDAGRFIASLRRGLGAQTHTIVFFQIPEALRILRSCAFEDIYHEHCAYFTPGSLARLFRRNGFEVRALSVEYAGQYLTIEARPLGAGDPLRPALTSEDDLAEVARLVATFPLRCSAKLAHWRQVLEQARADSKRVGLWGSGSKAVAFLSALDPEARIRHVTDINPYRHNHFMPLSGQRILPPTEFAAARPDLVIVMNGIYQAEIRRDLAAMGLSPELRSL